MTDLKIQRKISISNLPEGHGIDRALLTNAIEKFYDKMSERMAGETALEVHFKESRTSGRREQVETNIKLITPTISLHSQSQDWNAAKSLKSACVALEKEAEKALHKKGHK